MPLFSYTKDLSMLQELRIQNLALIDALHLDITHRDTGLIVLTGETGAGKSIILQAIHLLIGGRASASWVRSGFDQAVIEACFMVRRDHKELNTLLVDHGLQDDTACIIRRIVNRNGRTRMYVNDRAVTKGVAGELTEHLINIASQQDHQQLLLTRRHIDFLDSYGELWGMRQQFSKLFRRWQQISSTLRELQEKEQDKEQRRDFLLFQLTEIHSAELVAGEDEQLIQEKDRLKSSAVISELAGKSHQLMKANLMDSLVEIRKNMEQLITLDPQVQEIAERVQSACFEIEDLEDGVRRYLETIPTDISRLGDITSRLAVLKQLQRKYGPTLEDVIAFGKRAEEELKTLDSLEQEVAQLEAQIELISTEALLKATELSAGRKEIAIKLAAAVKKELGSLSFNNPVFEVAVNEPAELGLEGIQLSGRDKVEFLFSANPGEPPKSLSKVVSGGELSRLMLAMKCLLAKRDQVDTVIFDEVDAGISGQAAESVALKIQELSTHHQVFCITHLPQIAAYADEHFKVEKKVNQGRTRTEIVALEKEKKVEELARMLAGEKPTGQTLAYARELVELRGEKVIQ